jgi:DNA-binding winged helix-turn-helix (wHTH) protein
LSRSLEAHLNEFAEDVVSVGYAVDGGLHSVLLVYRPVEASGDGELEAVVSVSEEIVDQAQERTLVALASEKGETVGNAAAAGDEISADSDRLRGSMSRLIEEARRALERDDLPSVRTACESIVNMTSTPAGGPRVMPARNLHAFRVGDIVLDPRGMLVHRGGEVVHLTHGEFWLLATLLASPGNVLTAEQILDEVYGSGLYRGDRARNLAKVFVGRIRQKLEHDPLHPTLVLTVRGAGYVVRADVSDEPGPVSAEVSRPPWGEPEAEPDGDPPAPLLFVLH